MADIDKYPFLYSEESDTASAIAEILNDDTIEEEDEREQYVLAILSPEFHSHYKKWKYGQKKVTFMECPSYEETQKQSEQEYSFIYSLLNAETAQLVVEIFQNNKIPESEKSEIINAIVGEEIFEKIEVWRRRDDYKELFLSAMKPGLRFLIEGKLKNEDFSSVETLLKATSMDARENYEKWRASTTTTINISPPCSYQEPECFPDEINIAVLSENGSIYQFLASLARIVVFSSNEHSKHTEIPHVSWATNDLFYYNLGCEIDGVKKTVRLIPIGIGTSFLHKSKIPESIKEIHGVIEYIWEFPSENREEDLSNILKKYFKTDPNVETLIVKHDKEGVFDVEEEDGHEYKCLGMFHYHNSLKQGILSDSRSNPSIIEGLSILSEEVKRMFYVFCNSKPVILKNRNNFVEVVYENELGRPDGARDKSVFGYNEIAFNSRHPFVFMESEDSDCDVVVEHL